MIFAPSRSDFVRTEYIQYDDDFSTNLKKYFENVIKYARRWLVEKEIAEQIAFFHLNNPSSQQRQPFAASVESLPELEVIS